MASLSEINGIRRRVAEMDARVTALRVALEDLNFELKEIRRTRPMPDNRNVLVTDELAKAAVRHGDIDGDIYRDGEIWADAESLKRWYAAAAKPPSNEKFSQSLGDQSCP